MKNSIMTSIAAVAVALMLAVVFVPTVNAEYGEDTIADPESATEDTDLIISLTTLCLFIAAGALAGGAFGFVIGQITSPNNGGDQADADRIARTSEASTILTLFNTVKNSLSSIMTVDTDLWSFTQSYWSRAAELASCEMWDDGGYDATSVIDVSGLRATAANYLYTYQSAIDSAYYQLSGRAGSYGSMSVYSGSEFEYGFAFKGSDGTMHYYPTTKTSDSRLYVDLCTMAMNVETGKNLVYIDTDLMGVDETSGDIYVFGNNGYILNRDTGSKYFPTNGVIDTQNYVNNGKSYKIPSGYYILSPGCSYAGNITASGSSISPSVIGTTILVNDDTIGYAFVNGDSLSVNMGTNVTFSNADDLCYYVKYNGYDLGDPNNKATAKDWTVTSNLTPVLKGWNSLASKIDSVIFTTSDDGKVMWDTLTSIGGTDRADKSYELLSPSSITIPNSNVSMTSDQKRMMYTLALEQISDFYDGTKSSLNQDVSVSADSLELVCYGDIMYNGKVLVQNAVYTPISCLRDQTLKVNIGTDVNSWTGGGAAMVWGTTEDFSSFDTSNLSNGQFISLSSSSSGEKYTMKINDIVYKGSIVDTFTLTVNKMSKVVTSQDGWTDPLDSTKVTSTTDIIKIVALIIGIIAILAGLYTRNMTIVIIGAAVIVVGYLFAGVLVDVLFNGKSLGDALNPFKWF